VEIDESKFGKRKYNRGHRVGGVWVVGGVERNTEAKNGFAVPVLARSAPVLLLLIKRFVHPQSIILTDCWKGYSEEDLASIGMVHDTVNHSRNFVDPVSGVHINTIEGTWNAIKRQISYAQRRLPLIGPNLMYYWWRKRFHDVSCCSSTIMFCCRYASICTANRSFGTVLSSLSALIDTA
jgi:transposase-like protein